jgi:D-cysteine desulfhydrase
MPSRTLREVGAMLLLIEHGTSPLGGRLRRFTSLDPASRGAYLAGLEARGGLLAQAYRGLRDLVMVAYYQQPSAWKAIGYEGPRVPLDYDPRGPLRAEWPAYDALVAPRGAVPRGAVT